MDALIRTRLTRRQLQKLALPAPLAFALLGGRAAGVSFAQSDAGTATPSADATPVLAPTPACGDEDDFEETLAQTEGPYFTPDSPERQSLLEEGMPGTELLLTGYVYTTACQPVEGALIDFWQANDAGEYDNAGYTLRGHQFTDEDGRYELTTIVPGLYPGRTRHIHVKVQAPDQPELTTQLYFPDVPENDSDGIFDPSLVMDLEDDGDHVACPSHHPGGDGLLHCQPGRGASLAGRSNADPSHPLWQFAGFRRRGCRGDARPVGRMECSADSQETGVQR
jgi:protocatechuate 3,4-dioxygenase beta subunit